MITLEDIKGKFYTADSIGQVGNKQLFIVYYTNYTILVSYLTTVGFSSGSGWLITTEKHSPTTTRQLGQFSKSVNYKFVSPDVLEHKLSLYHYNK